MKIEPRNFPDQSFLLLISENEGEASILDLAGRPGDRVEGELCLSAGVGPFYLRLPAARVKASVDAYKRTPASTEALDVRPFDDGIPLQGEGAPVIRTIDDLLQWAATVRTRFGNTIVKIKSLRWGSLAMDKRPGGQVE